VTEEEALAATRALQPHSRKVTLSELEQHLGAAANILRGPVDQADFKSYIFPLLFFKRISDVYLEELQQALEESGGDAGYANFAENHRFQIPPDSHWEDVRARTENVGQGLTQALRRVETANPDSLYGIFGDTQWANKERLSDALLVDLIEHFSELPMTNAAVAPDVLGQAYEFLIKRFADASNRKAGEFYTPRPVVRMLVNVLDPQAGETVYDPACGTGGMLIEVVEHVKDAGGRPQLLYGKLFGQEKNLTTSGIARMNLFLHGVEDFKIVRGDTLRDPAFYDRDVLATFDCVIANPPFSLEGWGEEEWSSDRFGRNMGGTPPRNSGDYAWVQHMLASMAAKTGRVAVVLPQGALFRRGAEGRIREAILNSNQLEAVIGLAPNLFYGAGLAACVLIFRDRKPADRSGRVLFVDAAKLFKRGRNQNTLEPEHAQQILGAYRAFTDVAGFAHVADLDEIKASDYNLNISLYVEPSDDGETLTVEQATANLDVALAEVVKAEDHLRLQLRQWGLLA
jgi:type I restriction system adenine methylase HsdM